MSTSLSSLEKVLFGCEKLTLSRQSSGQTQSYRHYSLSRGHCSPPEQTWTNVICPYLCQVFMSRATSMGSEAVPPRMLGPSWWTSPFAPDCDRWVTAHVFQAFSSYAPVRDVFQSALLSIFIRHTEGTTCFSWTDAEYFLVSIHWAPQKTGSKSPSSRAICVFDCVCVRWR